MSKNPLQLYRETSKTGDIDDTDPLKESSTVHPRRDRNKKIKKRR
jgi:hypothetical protein